jgi:hypothetical protein
LQFIKIEIILLNLSFPALKKLIENSVYQQANVVCKQLGFPLGAQTAHSSSYFGTVSANFSYDNVECLGSETTLDACKHLNVHDCGTNEGAGVTCKTS